METNRIPYYFPISLQKFIKSSRQIFEKICKTSPSLDLNDKNCAMPDKKNYDWSRINCASVFTMTFLDDIKEGADITKILYDRIPPDIRIPNRFKKLCRIENGNYTIINTNKSIKYIKKRVLYYLV